MKIQTKYFGEMDIDDSKIITFEEGIFGFEEAKQYVILNQEKEPGEQKRIAWLQSVDNSQLALPVISSLYVKEDYAPSIADELLEPIGTLNVMNTYILLVMTVPADITKMTVNLKAPIIINTDTHKGVQAVADNAEYEIRYKLYDILQKKKEEKGE